MSLMPTEYGHTKHTSTCGFLFLQPNCSDSLNQVMIIESCHVVKIQLRVCVACEEVGSKSE